MHAFSVMLATEDDEDDVSNVQMRELRNKKAKVCMHPSVHPCIYLSCCLPVCLSVCLPHIHMHTGGLVAASLGGSVCCAISTQTCGI